MEDEHIEIHAVSGLRIDANGRVGRLRVIGVADRRDQRIAVDACVAQLDSSSAWQDQGASATARSVDHKRTFVSNSNPVFTLDSLKPAHERRTAYFFVAEIDVLATPAVPPFLIGSQPVPVNVRAQYVFGDNHRSIGHFGTIAPAEEFDVGVLFVHGIGKQRRAETLAQWSAPLLRWINAWLEGASDEIASKLRREPLEGWLYRLAVVSDLAQVDLDYVDRAKYAKNLVRKALAQTYKTWQDELRATIRHTSAMLEQRGMTPQEQSDADAVIGTIESVIGASAVGGSAEFREAYVLDVGTHAIDPSSVEMHVEAMAADGYMLRSRWMLAESHWAESFWAPSFFSFGRWCLMTAPVLLVHYIAMSRLRHNSWLRWIPSAFALAAAVTIAQLVFLLLTVLWLVPWERVRSAVLRLQVALAGVVGDSYILLEDPVQRRAILERVARDLEWLVQRCRHVVLIAHSQGAAVAEQVLSQRERAGSGKIEKFATLGAGVQTLDAIHDLSRSRDVKTAGWAAICCVLLIGAAAILALMGARAPALELGIAAAIGLIVASQRAWIVHPGRRAVLPRAAWARDWFDFFARKDLVPYGPLVDPQNNGPNYKPKEVRNRDSYIDDHVTYWQNPEQVVGPLARLIGSVAGFPSLTQLLPDDDAALARLERARLSRLGFLRLARLITLIATALALYAHWGAWFAIGSWGFAWVQSKLGTAIGALRAPARDVWLQALVVLVPFVVYTTLVNAIFDGWTTAEVERLLRRSAGKPAAHWAALLTMLLVVVLAGTIEWIRPLNASIAAVGTLGAAIVCAWVARSAHRMRVERTSR